MPANNFSARWTKPLVVAEDSSYTFTVTITADDGARLFVDGVRVLVVDGWFYQPPTTYSADVALTEGLHTVVVEYFEWAGGAVAAFSEAKVADG